MLLPIGSDNMLDDGAAWHPETFQPLGPNEVIWLTGHEGISPLLGHWLPLPYLRVMTDKAAAGSRLDQGPLNWVRIFISPPDGPVHEAVTLKAVLAIDTQLAGGSRLDQRRYNAPSLEDGSLGSTFVLADNADQLSDLLSAAWLNDWLREILRGDSSQPDSATGAVTRFDQEHIARYLFLLKVLCEACPAPILRFASQTREQTAVEATANELILDLSDEVGLAVLIEQETDEWSADTGRSRVLAIRDLAQPTNLHTGPLPVRVEFNTAQFGYSRISRQSGRSDAFKWSSLVRIGNEAARIALRPNATTGMTGSAGLARNVQDIAPIAGMWRRSTDTGPYGKLGPPSHSLAMQYLAESGEFIGTDTTTQPALRPRFSRSSLLTLFIAELVLQAVSALNAPRNAKDSGTTSGKPAFLSTLRLSLPISIELGERDTLLARAREGIDFVWCAQGWDDDESGQAPPKPAVELGLGGDFGVQMLYLHGQLNDIYGGDLAAFVEDLNPVRKPTNGARQVVQFASIAVGFSATRVVIADYSMVDIGGIRPRLVATQTEAQGLDDIHDAIIDHYLLPAVEAALLACNARLAADATDNLLGRRQPGKAHAPGANSLPDDVALGLVDKVLRPAARALLELYAGSPSGGARGIEWLTVAGLVKRGGGRLEPMGDVIDNIAANIGADGFKLARVSVPFSRLHISQSHPRTTGGAGRCRDKRDRC